MQLLHSRNAWTFSYGFNMMVDFCLWALETDGLHVPPFDQHADGDGSLRVLGLDGEHWQRWLARVVQLQHEQDELFRKNRAKKTIQERMALFSPEVHDPSLAWQGSESVRQRLISLWQQYGKISNERNAWEQPLTRMWQKEERHSGKRLFDELHPYHTRIAPITIHLVAYQQPLIYLIPPTSIIMSANWGQPNADEFRARVLEAAVGLTNYTPKKRGNAPVFTLSAFQQAGASPIKYKTYEARPMQIPVAGQQPPVTSDPIKQAVYRYLNDTRHFNEMDWDSVHFEHEKEVSDWHICWITFAEKDGDEHRWRMSIGQDEEGKWRVFGSSGSLMSDKQWVDFFVPAYDHPQILLSGSKGQGMRRKGDDEVYDFFAEGKVVDNSFNVVRVQLSNERGQVFEDRVEQGKVFFAAIGSKEVEWPMQAELYDHNNKLVWQQRVFDYKLPPG